MKLTKRLLTTLQILIKNGRIQEAELGFCLAALFDLCVSLEYAKRITGTGWVYCPASQNQSFPLLTYPYTKACPRCASHGEVIAVKAHKPGSDFIGQTSSKTIGAMLFHLNLQIKSGWRILQTSRRVSDVDMLLFTDQIFALCEIKASPLIAFPLVVRLESELTEQADENTQVIREHREISLPLEKAGTLCLYIPHVNNFYDLGSPLQSGYPIRNFLKRYGSSPELVLNIIRSWESIYNGYVRKWNRAGDECLRWLTFGCGGGVDDSKNSPGLDRTDDIKKGIYQMLKLSEHFSAKCQKGNSLVALIGNIHAVHHYDDYMAGFEEIVWAYESRFAEDLSDNGMRSIRVQDIVNLYDALITFTSSHFRNDSLANGFSLSAIFEGLGGNPK